MVSARPRPAQHLLDGPAVLVGHSYGGAVITEAGNHPKVVALAYVAAFAPDKGESVGTLIADPAPGEPVPPILLPRDGFLFLDREQFAASFAADVPAATAAFMADAQVPSGLDALNGAVSEPAWRARPSWYLVTTDDRMIPPPAQRAMAERAGARAEEVPGSRRSSRSRSSTVMPQTLLRAPAGRVPGRDRGGRPGPASGAHRTGKEAVAAVLVLTSAT
ncbi:alpha/beta hydrolase [Kitasatospora sp. NPDC094011]|uniref:alpha/beta hydrolase n=1 Tax=Kitasatospora sp. NPDC094011 TaxID=3364090 RepID=UPI0037FBAAA0